MNNLHQPVMPGEVIHYLEPKFNQNYIDCTLGGGGHAQEILNRIAPQGRLLGIDLDDQAIVLTTQQLKIFKKRVTLVQDNFKNLKKIADDCKFNKISGILLDLGLSSNQLQDNTRGFSFLATGKLDMRFSLQSEMSAGQILNDYSANDLIKIFQEFGEEKLAKLITDAIVKYRQSQKIESAQQLVPLIISIYKNRFHDKSKINPATKVFQALRIAVNDELGNLKSVLPQAIEILAPGGRLVVISYHSLEDRIVKNFFQQETKDCICPPKTPVCQCGHKKTLKIITKKPVTPTPEELAINPRSRSAKLRSAQKI